VSTNGFQLNAISASHDEPVSTRSSASTLLPSFSVEYYHRYASGWCHECGRKRGNDGRCARCDGWWTSPLLIFGFPIIAVTTTLLFLLLPLFQPSNPRHEAVVVLQNKPAQAAFSVPIPAIAQPLPFPAALRLPAAPATSIPSVPPIAPAVAVGPSIDQANLRQQIDYAAGLDRVYDAQRAMQRTIITAPRTFVPGATIPRPFVSTAPVAVPGSNITPTPVDQPPVDPRVL
jgi:hypothetical protein